MRHVRHVCRVHSALHRDRATRSVAFRDFATDARGAVTIERVAHAASEVARHEAVDDGVDGALQVREEVDRQLQQK